MGELNLKIFRTMHIPDTSLTWETAFWSSGVIIDNRILFTSDTKFDRKLIDEYDAIFEFDAIFHDCQFFGGGDYCFWPDILDSLIHYILSKDIHC